MGLSDRQIRRMTEERVVSIDDVDTTNNFISMHDQYGTSLQASIDFAATVVRIPVSGEVWIAERRNMNWYLKHKQGNLTQDLNPGDVLLDAPETVHINGTQILLNGVAPGANLMGVSIANISLNTGTGDAAFSVPTGASTPIAFAHFTTNDDTIFGTSLNDSTTVHNLTGDNTIVLRANGVYQLTMACSWAGGDFNRYTLFNASAGDVTIHGVTSNTSASTAHSADGSTLWQIDTRTLWIQSAPATFHISAFQNSGSTQTINRFFGAVVYAPLVGSPSPRSY